MSKSEVAAEWLSELRPGVVRELFEYLPNMLYFAKDSDLRLMAGNRAFVRRCGFEREEEMVGKYDHEIFPAEMAEKYSSDDRQVLATGEPMTEMVELFPNELGEPEWFVTDKIPLFSKGGKIAGLCGMVRSMEGAHDEIQLYLQLREASEYLHANYTEKVSMETVARIAGLSLRQLERRFRETFKTSPREYITKLRVLRACELLSGSAKPITEIALDSGFYDHSSFSKKFRQMMGQTPRDYRKKFRRTPE